MLLGSLFGGRSSPQGTASPLPVAIYTSDVCVEHNPGSRFGVLHPEQPDRLKNLIDAMRGPWHSEFGDLMRIREPEVEITQEALLRVHSEEYLNRLQDAFERVKRPAAGGIQPRVNLDQDTVVSVGTQAAVSRATGLVVAAVDDVLGRSARDGASSDDDAVRRAFVMVRPPGHHAEAGKAMGFCLFNNVMVGVAHAQAVHGLDRVAILDFDVHQ